MVTAKEASPGPIIQTIFAPLATEALFAGVELDLFSQIKNGNRTLEHLAKVLQANPRGLRMLLNALSALGFLSKSKTEEAYDLTPVSSAYLIQGQPLYLGGIVSFQEKMRNGIWSSLKQSVKTGKPVETPVESGRDDGEYFAKLVENIYPLSAASAEWLAHVLKVDALPGNPQVLDIGAGTAVWSLPMAKANPNVKVTVVDFPVVLEITKKYAKKAGVEKQMETVGGNFREINFGKSRFDIAVLGHICHSEGEKKSKQLFQKIAEALKPDGKLVIADFFPDENRSKEILPLLFAINMLVNTEEGDTFTLNEYVLWLKEAGFTSVNVMQMSEDAFPVIIAEKKCRKP